MNFILLLFFNFIYSNYSFNIETNFLNNNIGKNYPIVTSIYNANNKNNKIDNDNNEIITSDVFPLNIINSKLYNFRCLTIRPRPYIENKKKYIIDIDGTICNTYKSDYFLSAPKINIIKYFNKLYDDGNQIHYWTARGSVSGKNWDKLTVQQLKSWNCKYDSINIGKPHYDIWIDDKSINIKDIKL